MSKKTQIGLLGKLHDVCPVVNRILVNMQSGEDEWLFGLIPLLPLLSNSRGSKELTHRRAFRCADWAVREVAPFLSNTAGCYEQAQQLYNLAPIVDKASAKAAEVVAKTASDVVRWRSVIAYACGAACFVGNSSYVGCAEYVGNIAETMVNNGEDSPFLLLKELLEMKEG